MGDNGGLDRKEICTKWNRTDVIRESMNSRDHHMPRPLSIRRKLKTIRGKKSEWNDIHVRKSIPFGGDFIAYTGRNSLPPTECVRQDHMYVQTRRLKCLSCSSLRKQ
ncbi:hypothetical protein RHGRI_004388 [Rhododendron griersonianum]|uniref:Uncharacterized protein n=1 Tax=Rhododendron griersonianum TaxID=479676 RepID=A0AAV6L8H1_9ERIC|nr:hypothetical protein RHGRI_004388 [Rhododendron griersonianum]